MAQIDVPPIWLLAHAVAAWLLAVFAPLVTVTVPNWLGWAVFAAGLAWVASAAAMFFRTGTPLEPRKAPTVLLATGHFRVNRNPIYTGMVAMLLGWAMVLGAVSALLPVLVFPALITRRFVVGEERGLRDAFGEEAERYFANTRRW